MQVYNKPSESLMSIINAYAKKGENFKVSNALELNSKCYKEIIFYKKSIFSFKDEILGYIYIDENNQAITSQNVQRELARLAYFYQLFYSDERGIGILAAMKSEDDFEGDKARFEEAIEGLDYLNSQGVQNIDKIKKVVIKLPDLREEGNFNINKLSNMVKESLGKDVVFNEEEIKTLYPVYENVMRLNFEKVKLIGTLEDYCDSVKDAAEKEKKKLNVRFNQKIVIPIVKASDQISYFRKVIRTYRSVLNMNTSQYIRFLEDINKNKIEQRINLIRNAGH